MRAAGRLRGNLDGAGPRHRRGRDQPGVGEALWILARIEVAQENDSCARDCDEACYQQEYSSLGVHLPVSQICWIA
jgi:hypothetical protein